MLSAFVCAYSDAACTTPAGSCATDVTYGTSTITGTVTDLPSNTYYYVKVTAATEGGPESAVAGPFKTASPTMSITSNPVSDTVKLCGESFVQVTYNATVSGENPTTYTWTVNGTDSTSVTGNTLVVRYTSASSNTVTCTAAGVSAAVSTTVTFGGTVPMLGLCEECFIDSIQVKVKTNVSSIVWRNSSNDSVSNGLTGLKKSDSIPAGVYTATAKSSDGCTVTRTATLGNYVAHPCTVAVKRGNELGSTETTIDSVKDHQHNWYKVVQIGSQCWLAENMRCTTSPKSWLVLGGTSGNDFDSPKYYDYGTTTGSQKVTNLRDRGYLYNWAGAMDSAFTTPAGSVDFPYRRGICPEGWHLPTDSEWKILEKGYLTETDGTTPITDTTLNKTGYRGKGAGKFAGGCDWKDSSSSGTYPNNYSYAERNSTGFSALPTGECIGSYSVSFSGSGRVPYFWSVTSYSGTNAYGRYLTNSSEGVVRGNFYKRHGFSVRCVRNEPGVTMGAVTKTDSTGNTLSVSAAYTATKTVTSATVCAYTDAACTIPAGTCATSVTYGTSTITGTVTDLTPNTYYYVKVTAITEGGPESAVAGPFGTDNAPMSITRNPSTGTVKLCGGGGTVITYKATVTAGTATSYTWSTSGGTATASTTDTYIVTYTSAASYTVSCTANGASVSATTSVTISGSGAAATMALCEDYTTPSVSISSTNCTTASLVWKNCSNEVVLTGDAILNGVTNGYYTVTGTNADGCSVTKSVYLGSSNQVGCIGNPRSNETVTGGIITQVKDHQNNSYDVVSISGFCIMKQNLRVTTSPVGHTLSPWAGNSTAASYYTQNTTFGNEGYVYNWRAALDTTIDVSTIGAYVDISNRRGLCPQGWHLPTRSEWTAIVGCHDAGQFAAPNGSYTETNWHSCSTANTPGNISDPDKNATGFSGVPVGYRGRSSFLSVGSYTCFWSATSFVSEIDFGFDLSHNTNIFREQSNLFEYLGVSIRCVRDN